MDLSYCRKTDVVLFNANVLHVGEKTTGAQGQVSYITTCADILIHTWPRQRTIFTSSAGHAVLRALPSSSSSPVVSNSPVAPVKDLIQQPL